MCLCVSVLRGWFASLLSWLLLRKRRSCKTWRQCSPPCPALRCTCRVESETSLRFRPKPVEMRSIFNPVCSAPQVYVSWFVSVLLRRCPLFFLSPSLMRPSNAQLHLFLFALIPSLGPPVPLFSRFSHAIASLLPMRVPWLCCCASVTAHSGRTAPVGGHPNA